MLGTLHPTGLNVDFNISNGWNLLMCFVDTALYENFFFSCNISSLFLPYFGYILPLFRFPYNAFRITLSSCYVMCRICGVWKCCTPKLDWHCSPLVGFHSISTLHTNGTCSLLYTGLNQKLCAAHKQNTTCSNSIVNDIINIYFMSLSVQSLFCLHLPNCTKLWILTVLYLLSFCQFWVFSLTLMRGYWTEAYLLWFFFSV